jgi:hypothetical protein
VRVSFLNPPMFMCNDIFAVPRRICFVSPVNTRISDSLSLAQRNSLPCTHLSLIVHLSKYLTHARTLSLPAFLRVSLSHAFFISLARSRALSLFHTHTLSFSLTHSP